MHSTSPYINRRLDSRIEQKFSIILRFVNVGSQDSGELCVGGARLSLRKFSM